MDDVQRNFNPMVEAVQLWRGTQITDTDARLKIYEAFIEGQLEAPRHLARVVHDQWTNPPHEESSPGRPSASRTPSPAPSKELDPIP